MSHTFLAGDRVDLRGLEEADLVDPYFQWFNDAEVCRYNSHAVFPNTLEKMRSYFESIQSNQREVVFAIIQKSDQRHIGNVALKGLDPIARCAEFAIVVGEKDTWGKGFGREATKLIIDYGFERLNLNRIYLGTHQDNAGMRRLAESLGMKEEGRRREALYKSGVYADVIEYGILRREWEASRS